MTAGERPGKIITISSGAYASGRLGASHYCASKAGIIMFSRVLAMEVAAQRTNGNCIAPGYINTKLDNPPVASAFRDAMLKNIPWGRFGTPADVAQTAPFLASPAAVCASRRHRRLCAVLRPDAAVERVSRELFGPDILLLARTLGD
jgi:NAD(P)-dependent dehydrogenase (short-subunit alcohol dehydrogenase family)